MTPADIQELLARLPSERLDELERLNRSPRELREIIILLDALPDCLAAARALLPEWKRPEQYEWLPQGVYIVANRANPGTWLDVLYRDGMGFWRKNDGECVTAPDFALLAPPLPRETEDGV